MPRRREIPFSPRAEVRHTGRSDKIEDAPLEAVGHGRGGAPDSALVALMEAAPGDAIPLSQEELLPLRDVLQDAMDRALDDRERWIVDAIVVERKSFAALGRELNLSKSHVHRLYHEAVAKLAETLRTEDIIQSYLQRGNE